MAPRIFRRSLLAFLVTATGCGLTTVGVLDGPDPLDGSLPGDASNDLSAPDATGDSSATDTGQSDADAGVLDSGPCVGMGGANAVATDAGFCIHRTEVTNGAYLAFLASAPDAGAQPAECAWNATFVPALDWPPTATGHNVPVDYVDWCDARAYCQWAGLRLCGKIGGGGLPTTDFKDAGQSQWFHACSHGDDGAHTYSYGNTYVATTCNEPSSGRADAGSYSGCVGGYPGLYDMTGNLWEWEDSCNADAGAADSCHIRGGGWSDNAVACAVDFLFARNTAAPNVGFRCCSN